MDVVEGGREARLDLRLGKIAVSKGLITAAQLEDALREQELGVKRGRKKPRRLGVILAAKRLLTDDQVVALLEEQEARIVAEDRRTAEDRLLGRILIDGGFTTPEGVEECLRLQEAAVQQGSDEIPLLGKLLVEKGHATPQAIEEALELQEGVSSDDLEEPEGEAEPEPEPEPPPAPPEPEPSDVEKLNRLGKYTIIGLLGRGAMGEVYEALDPQLNRKLALKVIRGELDSTRPDVGKEVERFIQEARLAARLTKHPHIVNVYEADVSDGRHYIAMELVRGMTFAEWRKKGSASLRQQVKVLRTVALAVHYAHEHGILHRDLKPGNVLVDDDQRPFVTDFGLAKPQEVEDRTACGSPLYVSPEQAQGLPGIDRRTDVYSLGVMLYEVLEGHPPFKESTRAATLKKVIHDPVPPFSSLGRAKPFTTADREIEAVCLKALAKKPEQRHATAEAFAKELGRWLEKKTLTTETAQFPVKLWSSGLVRIGAAAGVVLLLVAAAALLRSRAPAERQDLARADKLVQSGDYAQGFELYDQSLRKNPSDAEARAGREEARRKLIAAAVLELDKAMIDLDKARHEVDAIRKRPRPQTLDQEQRQADDRRAAEERVPKAEERVRSIREQLQQFLTLGAK